MKEWNTGDIFFVCEKCGKKTKETGEIRQSKSAEIFGICKNCKE